MIDIKLKNFQEAAVDFLFSKTMGQTPFFDVQISARN